MEACPPLSLWLVWQEAVFPSWKCEWNYEFYWQQIPLIGFHQFLPLPFSGQTDELEWRWV